MSTTAVDLLPDFMLIGEERITTSTRGDTPHIYPGDGTVQVSLPLGSADDVDRAVQAAQSALAIWGAWDPLERRRAIMRLAGLLVENRDELGIVLSREIGYPLSQSPFIVDWGVSWLDTNAGWADKLYGDVLPTQGYHNFTSVGPLGVIGVIPTWNGSIGGFGMSAGPVLAAGCTMVLKPSEFAPFGPLRCAELALEAGIPPGVINVVTGDGDTAQALISHPGIEKIVFTGSPPTARKIAATCAELLRPAVFELGGKSAFIVAEDARLDTAVAAAAMVALGAGQQCTLGSRLLVHEKVYDDFAAQLDAALRAVKVGDPFAADTQMGPVVSQGSLERILGIIERSHDYGTVVTGGERLEGDLKDGFFLQPTVIGDVDNSSEIARTELFGPVLAMMKFSDDDQAIAMANDSDYALAGYVHTTDLDRAHRLATAMDTENIGINGAFIPLGPGLPFGGRKQSGYGKQGGLAGVMEFVRTRQISMRLA